MKTKEIGFIGLGSMGKAMATNIIRAGYPLSVFDIRKESITEMKKLGAKVAGNAREVGQDSDTVIVMVLDFKQVKEAVLPPDGALGGMQKGKTLIITSTITPQNVMEIENAAREYGVSVLDSPVSGGRLRAEDASLALMVGGEAVTIEENEGILKAMGSNLFHVGKVGQGQAMKVINQILVSANIISVAEAVVTAEKLGIDLQKMYEVITKSAGTSEVLQKMGSQMIARDFTVPRVTVDILVKDTDIIMDTMRSLDMSLPVSSTVHQVYRMAKGHGLGQKDVTSVLQLIEEFAGL